jgi:demethylmenaquinone methyltransferase/2-methoxy-6-polyprenyl-1,4-benzoquinol methylase
MATILRDLSYRYQRLYDGISQLAALSVGGEARLRQLPLTGLTIAPGMTVLDLCCGSGQATQVLVQTGAQVTGLDASPRSLQRAQHNVPQATYVEAFAEAMPFADGYFDLVHTSAAMHEMETDQLRQVFNQVHRVLKPGGIFTLADFHQPTNPLFLPSVALFLWLFETETAWQWLRSDAAQLLIDAGFQVVQQQLFAGGSLQVVQAQRS